MSGGSWLPVEIKLEGAQSLGGKIGGRMGFLSSVGLLTCRFPGAAALGEVFRGCSEQDVVVGVLQGVRATGSSRRGPEEGPHAEWGGGGEWLPRELPGEMGVRQAGPEVLRPSGEGRGSVQPGSGHRPGGFSLFLRDPEHRQN